MSEPPSELDDLLRRGYRYALSLTHDPDRARDVLQDACLSISQSEEAWDLGYLLTTIRNRYIDLYRRDQRRSVQSLDGDRERSPVDANWSDAFDGLDAGYDDALAAALQKLRDAERECLYLSVVAEYSTEQIVDLTGAPRGTVLSRIHRARAKLHRWLTSDNEHELS